MPLHASEDSVEYILSGVDADRYDSIWISGYLVLISDVIVLARAGILTFDPGTRTFSFSRDVPSEAGFRRQLSTLPVKEKQSFRELYRRANVKLPNSVAHTLTVPSGFGPWGYFIDQNGGVQFSLGLGGVNRAPGTGDPDGGVAIGANFGNSFEGVGVSATLSQTDLSNPLNRDRLSLSLKLTRYVGDGLSVSVGGENMLVRYTDSSTSYYLVGSYSFNRDKSILPFDGVATLGVGNGRFSDKGGTVVFGALAMEISPMLNLLTDWDGQGLNIGAGFRSRNRWVAFTIGVRNLTDRGNDGTRVFGSVSIPLSGAMFRSERTTQ